MKQLIIFTCLFQSVISFAQDVEREDERKLIITFSEGFVTRQNIQISDDSWNKYAPGFMSSDTMGPYTSYNMGNNLGSTSIYSTLKLDLSYSNSFLKQKHITPTFGLIMGYGVGTQSNEMYLKTEYTLFDVLVSQQNGNSYSVYEVKDNYFSRRFESSDVLLGITNHYMTNTKKLISFMTGIEVLYSISAKRTIQISHIENTYYQTDYLSNSSTGYNSNQNYFNSEGFGKRYESTGPSVQSVYVRIPLELSVRLGKKENFFGNSRMGVENNIAISLQVIERKKSTNFTNWFGINYKFIF